MTKARDPLGFAKAVTTVCDLIGWAEAAAIVGRAQTRLRKWSVDNSGEMPNVAQAVALDRAFMEAGGGYAPLAGCYMRQLEVDRAAGAPCRIELAETVAHASREFGEAFSWLVTATQPGATRADYIRAIDETEDLDALMPRLIGPLTALSHGNGAVLGFIEGGRG